MSHSFSTIFAIKYREGTCMNHIFIVGSIIVDVCQFYSSSFCKFVLQHTSLKEEQ